MERHQLMVHCKDEVLNCPTCDFNCTNKETLSEHLYSHAGKLSILNYYLILKVFVICFINIIYYLQEHQNPIHVRFVLHHSVGNIILCVITCKLVVMDQKNLNFHVR